jgi:rubredoxin
METSTLCPRCGSDETVEIVYGYPGPDLTSESLAGNVTLGGCMVWPEAPDWRCVQCGHNWRDDTPPS